MNLRLLAEKDFGRILEDTSAGFGWPVVLTSPEGVSAPLLGLTNDIAVAVDPDTGELISGRSATVTVRIAKIREAGFDENPRGVSSRNSKPWTVLFKDINGIPIIFKVMRTNPDRTIGGIVMILESYKRATLYDGVWAFDGSIEYDGVLKYL